LHVDRLVQDDGGGQHRLLPAYHHLLPAGLRGVGHVVGPVEARGLLRPRDRRRRLVRQLRRRHQLDLRQGDAADEAAARLMAALDGGPDQSAGANSAATIEVLVQEGRTFPPPASFRSRAIIGDESVYEEAERDYDGFWLQRAREFVTWDLEPTQGLDWHPPDFTFFADGRLNVAWNCLDKHVEAGKGDKVAYHWIPEPPDEPHQSITYGQLAEEVGRVANALKELGV